MGTFVDIEVVGESRSQALSALEAAFSEMKRIECLFSRFLRKSPVSIANRLASTLRVQVPSEVIQLTEHALEYAQMTGGAFDLPIHPVVKLWEEAERRQIMPRPSEIRAARSRVGHSYISLNHKRNEISFAHSGVQLDFGGVGKGYALDRAVQILRELEIQKAFLNAGGNIFSLGEESSVGIHHPLKANELVSRCIVKNKAVATSANDERFFTIKGNRYGHLIDPRSGRPVNHEVISATVISPTARVADICSTSVFILGLEKGMRFIETHPSAEALIVSKGLFRPQIHTSTGFLRFTPPIKQSAA
jgi:FAD:protein FMN transferase